MAELCLSSPAHFRPQRSLPEQSILSAMTSSFSTPKESSCSLLKRRHRRLPHLWSPRSAAVDPPPESPTNFSDARNGTPLSLRCFSLFLPLEIALQSISPMSSTSGRRARSSPALSPATLAPSDGPGRSSASPASRSRKPRSIWCPVEIGRAHV